MPECFKIQIFYYYSNDLPSVGWDTQFQFLTHSENELFWQPSTFLSIDSPWVGLCCPLFYIYDLKTRGLTSCINSMYQLGFKKKKYCDKKIVLVDCLKLYLGFTFPRDEESRFVNFEGTVWLKINIFFFL